jgi:5-methylcytosine-specific restriction endonuclease McrA
MLFTSMTDRYHLNGLQDDELVAALPKLVARDNEHAADLLAYLAELDARRLYEDMRFSSIWEYCTEALGICQTTAWRKYTAARVCRRFPRMFAAVAQGEIQISVLAELNRYLNEQNADELFAQCRRKSFRQVQQLPAARFLKADVKDAVRRTPDRVKPELRRALATTPEPGTVAVEPRSATSPDAGLSLPDRPQPALPVSMQSDAAGRSAHRQVEPLSQDRFAVRFTADAEFLALLEEVRGLSAHRDPSGGLLPLLKAGFHAHQRELLKRRFAIGRTPRQRPKPASVSQSASANKSESELAAPHSSGRRSRRHIPAKAVREVYERDGGQCTFVSASGRRCSARRQLELDHIEPWAVSRNDSPANLRLLCHAHNQLVARRYFGKRYMREVLQTAPARATQRG